MPMVRECDLSEYALLRTELCDVAERSTHTSRLMTCSNSTERASMEEKPTAKGETHMERASH